VFISLIIVLPVSRLYQPHLGIRWSAGLDLLLVVVLSYAIVKLFQRFEE